MPTAYIEKLAKEGKGSVQELEKKWEDAKAAASEEGKSDNYGYITSIFQNMIGASFRIEASTRMKAAEKPIKFPDSPEGILKEFVSIIQNRNPEWKGDRRYNAGHYLYRLRASDASMAARVAELMESQASDHESLPERTMQQAIAVLRGRSSGL